VEEAGAGYETERRLFSDVTRAVLLGGAIGAVLGGVLGALIAIPVEGIGLVLAAVLGAVFGAGVGGSAGGLGATKYNSPAWAETYEAEPHGDVVVVVAHADAEVVDYARRILASASDQPA
jgi:outer membrane lipoprotein SlyB